MIAYYICRDVQRGSHCSYNPGRTLLNCVQRTQELADQLASKYNRFCNVSGVVYVVVPHDDCTPFDCDYYENGRVREETVLIAD